MTFLLALAVAAQTAQPAPAVPASIDAQTVLAALQPRLPQNFGQGFALTAAAAEGNLLILTFDVPADALQQATPEAISSELSRGFCSAAAARAVLDGPMSLRPDARVGTGPVMQGAVLERCPTVATPD